MPTKVEKDAVTGQETTGHEWDGIKELNTPLPKWWLYVMYATIAFAVLWWLLYPSWPYGSGYLSGILGYSQRMTLDRELAEAEAERADVISRIAAAEVQEIADDPELMSVAFAGGQAAFADNCAPCHGLGGAGQGPYPTLADDAWIWGGTPEAIHQTILYGIRSDHPDARFNEMPRFGVDQLLDRSQIEDVAEYVLSLSGHAEDPEAVERGAATFAEQCSFCHGEQGEGLQDLGAPALNDEIWLYGGTREEIIAQIWSPQQGVMPPWVNRLDEPTIKSLVVYVHSLGGGQ
jgi:cytochrome c oxidase cbb3-type subunit 3